MSEDDKNIDRFESLKSDEKAIDMPYSLNISTDQKKLQKIDDKVVHENIVTMTGQDILMDQDHSEIEEEKTEQFLTHSDKTSNHNNEDLNQNIIKEFTDQEIKKQHNQTIKVTFQPTLNQLIEQVNSVIFQTYEFDLLLMICIE